MAAESVLLAQTGGVATITLNRPESLNAIDDTLRRGLADALNVVEREHSIRAVVITGAGRGFCSGGDIRMMVRLKGNSQESELREYLRAGHEVVRKIRQIPKPVLGSVNGPAHGAGMNLALACDLRIASDEATFAQAFVRLGLHPDWGGTFFLPRLVGAGRAWEMFALGTSFTAAEAHRLGIVNWLTAADKLSDDTRALAERLAAAPALPLALLKQKTYERTAVELERSLQDELEAQEKCFGSEAFQEGIAAYLEKRKAVFD